MDECADASLESLAVSLTDQGYPRDVVATTIEHERQRLAFETSARLRELEAWLLASEDDPLSAEMSFTRTLQ